MAALGKDWISKDFHDACVSDLNKKISDLREMVLALSSREMQTHTHYHYHLSEGMNLNQLGEKVLVGGENSRSNHSEDSIKTKKPMYPNHKGVVIKD